MCSPPCCCFFWRAREFWNHTCVTRLLRPVICAMRSKSWPSGLLSNWKLACSTCSWSSVKVVLTRFAFDFWLHSESKKILIIISTLYRRTEARKNRGRGTEVLVHSLKKCIFFLIYQNKKLTPKSAGPSTSCQAHSLKKNPMLRDLYTVLKYIRIIEITRKKKFGLHCMTT